MLLWAGSGLLGDPGRLKLTPLPLLPVPSRCELDPSEEEGEEMPELRRRGSSPVSPVKMPMALLWDPDAEGEEEEEDARVRGLGLRLRERVPLPSAEGEDAEYEAVGVVETGGEDAASLPTASTFSSASLIRAPSPVVLKAATLRGLAEGCPPPPEEPLDTPLVSMREACVRGGGMDIARRVEAPLPLSAWLVLWMGPSTAITTSGLTLMPPESSLYPPLL